MNYTLLDNAYQPSAAEILCLQNHPPMHVDDWNNSRLNSYKTRLKTHTILKQLDRCAYCRKLIEADGYYEPIEHIVPKTLKPKWIFNVKNLIITCDRCNNLKSDTQTLADPFVTMEEFPEVANAFKIFNPHFENWEDHFKFENDIFLVPIPNSKGATTIKICKLYKYQIILNRAKELKLGQKGPMSLLIHRIRELDKNSDTYDEILTEITEALDHFNARVSDSF